MSSYEEKLSILSEMISLARVDQEIQSSEFDFLWGVAERLGVNRDDFETLFQYPARNIIPKTLGERILQFHRLVLLRMGLPPSAIDQVLALMHQYPDKIVPPDVLIGIFKAHYN